MQLELWMIIVAIAIGALLSVVGFAIGYGIRKKTAEAKIGSAEAQAIKVV